MSSVHNLLIRNQLIETWWGDLILANCHLSIELKGSHGQILSMAIIRNQTHKIDSSFVLQWHLQPHPCEAIIWSALGQCISLYYIAAVPSFTTPIKISEGKIKANTIIEYTLYIQHIYGRYEM